MIKIGVLMKSSVNFIKGAVCLGITLLLTACGGGGGGGSLAPSKPASSVAPASNAPSSSSSSSMLASSSSSATQGKCLVDGMQWDFCGTDDGSWGFENN